MEAAFSVLVGLFFAVGIYLILSKHIIRILLGIAIFGNAVNLLIFTSGRIVRSTAPIVPQHLDVLPAGAANPLPQALILTAIVITFAVSSFLLALIYRSWRLANADDLSDDADDVALREGTVAMPSEETAFEASTTDFPLEVEK